jgi:hypothetical protein
MSHTNAAKKITPLHLASAPFATLVKTKMYELGLNSHRLAKIIGADYPHLTKVLMHPDKFPFTEGQLSKLASFLPFSELVARERLERLYKEHSDHLFPAIMDFMNQNNV